MPRGSLRGVTRNPVVRGGARVPYPGCVNDSTAAARAAFARALAASSDVPDPRGAVEDAFARVPRDHFLGAPPWKVLPATPGAQAFETADSRELCADVLVSIDPSRQLNNGSPSLWFRAFAALDVQRGEHVVHAGTGPGYFTAVLAELVGPDGRVEAGEVDPTLAARAREALTPWPQVVGVGSDGLALPTEGADVIVASAGATHAPSRWLAQLRPGGRLYLPLTVNDHDPLEGLGAGAALLATRVATGAESGSGSCFGARLLHPIGIYPLLGARRRDENAALGEAFRRGIEAWGEVRSLRTEPHPADETCWVHVAGGCLSIRPPAPPIG